MDTPPTRSKIQLRAPQKIWRPKAAPSTNLGTTQPKETIHRPLTAQEDNQDYWEKQGEHWIRHQTTLRTTTLFTPTDGPGHPPINTLEPHRTTITHNKFGEVSQRKDGWTVMGNAALPFQWKGTTRFAVKKDYEYIQENHDEEQQHQHHEAHRARGLRQPQQPTPQQIAEHNLTHLPYRNWCPICVQRTPRQLQETTITTTCHSSRLCLHQVTTRPKDHTGTDSSRCYYTTVYDSIGSRQSINDGLHGEQPTSSHF